ncbi:hypothetical protein Q9L58_010719 [Maublancomyces gigas]|uniref:Uncharacterized protein n=1 Tax=Discina gigas TaxID=1032678 RepID=A0ABR3G3C8_9PEZI
MTQLNTTSTAIPSEDLGPAGIPGELQVLDIFADEMRLDVDRLRDMTRRQFKVAALLAKSETVAGDIKLRFDVNDGSSFLLVPKETKFSQVRCSEGMFELRKNSSGEHSLVDFECEAVSAVDARRKFILAVLPFLDYLTFKVDSPLFVTSLRIEDVKNQVRTLDYVSPYQTATINPHESNLFPELMPIFALYREAKNSGSNFYKFLCYHKLLDGLFGVMRANLFKQAKDKSVTLTRQRELVPDSAAMPASFRQYSGLRIKEFLDGTLTPRFRNAVAHFVTDDGMILNMSSPDHIDNYSDVLYVTELCVRVAIESYQSMLIELHMENNGKT